jgi:hypothetical protein
MHQHAGDRGAAAQSLFRAPPLPVIELEPEDRRAGAAEVCELGSPRGESDRGEEQGESESEGLTISINA